MPFGYTSGVTVSVYTGASSPETKIYSTPFLPRYLNYSSSSGFYPANKNLNIVPTETFVVFDKPVLVTSKKFFISYTIEYSTTSHFCVYNAKWNSDSRQNTAWLKDETKGWVPADTYEFQPMETSLAIHCLIRKVEDDHKEIIPSPGNSGFYFERSSRVITLKEPLNKPGLITIYSISGQLLEKVQIQPGQTKFFLYEQPKGTVGIVKITSNSFSNIGKIMY
jgi:hypothetical protein